MGFREMSENFEPGLVTGLRPSSTSVGLRPSSTSEGGARQSRAPVPARMTLASPLGTFFTARTRPRLRTWQGDQEPHPVAPA
jgi:hypothetical protein